jgi:hypothetical protein
MPPDDPSDAADHQVRFTRLSLDSIAEADSRFLLQLWNTKRGARRAPARSEFDPADLKHVLHKLILMEVRRDPLDFIYRVAGTEIYFIHGMELTGKSVRNLRPQPYSDAVWRDMAELIETWEPQYVRLEFPNREGRSRSYTVLRLPLSSDGATIDRIFVLSEFGPDRAKIKETIAQLRR